MYLRQKLLILLYAFLGFFFFFVFLIIRTLIVFLSQSYSFSQKLVVIILIVILVGICNTMISDIFYGQSFIECKPVLKQSSIGYKAPWKLNLLLTHYHPWVLKRSLSKPSKVVRIWTTLNTRFVYMSLWTEPHGEILMHHYNLLSNT